MSIASIIRNAVLLLMLLVAPAWAGETVDINTADSIELAAKLHGVGLTKAEAIVNHREMLGRFDHPDELTRVKGIGPATLEKNRKRITVHPPGDQAQR